MENNVVTLDTAKKLKAAGWSQEESEHDYFWTTPSSGLAAGRFTLRHMPGNGETFAAPTAQEIADQLPERTHIERTFIMPMDEREYIYLAWSGFRGYNVPEDNPVRADTMAEALALLWITLQEATN